MTRYLIEKYTRNDSGGFVDTESKTVKKKNLDDHINNGWVLIEEINPLTTPFKKWWNKFTTNQKIAVIAIVVPCFAVLGWISDKYFDYKYHSLNDKYNSLNEEYNQLKQNLTLTSDSLKTEREKSESLKNQLKSTTLSDKNQIEENKIKTFANNE